jgi:hypothetical protein
MAKTYSFYTNVSNGMLGETRGFDDYKISEFYPNIKQDKERSIRVKLILVDNDAVTHVPVTIKPYIVVEFWFVGYVFDGQFLTHPCEVGQYWGNDTCSRINLESIINKLDLPTGKWAVQIKPFKKVND